MLTDGIIGYHVVAAAGETTQVVFPAFTGNCVDGTSVYRFSSMWVVDFPSHADGADLATFTLVVRNQAGDVLGSSVASVPIDESTQATDVLSLTVSGGDLSGGSTVGSRFSITLTTIIHAASTVLSSSSTSAIRVIDCNLHDAAAALYEDDMEGFGVLVPPVSPTSDRRGQSWYGCGNTGLLCLHASHYLSGWYSCNNVPDAYEDECREDPSDPNSEIEEEKYIHLFLVTASAASWPVPFDVWVKAEQNEYDEAEGVYHAHALVKVPHKSGTFYSQCTFGQGYARASLASNEIDAVASPALEACSPSEP